MIISISKTEHFLFDKEASGALENVLLVIPLFPAIPITLIKVTVFYVQFSVFMSLH